MFVRNPKVLQHAWNSAAIDNTDITRSMAAVGRDFYFPLDVEMMPSPTLNSPENANLFQYLRDVSNESTFALSIVQILVKERCKYHQNRQNMTTTECTLQVGDIVKAHVQVNSSASKGIVSKLCYKSKGPFIITADLGHNSFEVQRYNQPHFCQT